MGAERRQLVLGRSGLVVLGLLAVGFLLYQLRGVLTPVFLAFTIAYILDPVVDRLEKWKIPRPAGVAIVFVSFVAVIVLFLLLIVPDVVRDLVAVTRELPGHVQRWATQAQPLLERAGIQVPKNAQEWIAQLQTHADKLANIPLAPLGGLVGQIVGGTVSAIGTVLAALIVPILAIYLLNDFDRIIAGARNLIPLKHRDHVVEVANEVDDVLSQFMRGQLTVMAILAVLYSAAYYALGIRLAVPIGIVAGILNIVPYFGSAFALVAGLLMALIGGGGWWQLAGVVGVYALIQFLEGFVITPKIVGESVGLREVWVLLALFVGGEVFGFLGVLLAMPVAAVLKILLGRAVASYRKSTMYQDDALTSVCIGPMAGELTRAVPLHENPVMDLPAAHGESVASSAPTVTPQPADTKVGPVDDEPTAPGAPSSKRGSPAPTKKPPEPREPEPEPEPED